MSQRHTLLYGNSLSWKYHIWMRLVTKPNHFGAKIKFKQTFKVDGDFKLIFE